MSHLLSVELHRSSTSRLAISMALARASQLREAESRMQELEAESLSLALPDGFNVEHKQSYPLYEAIPPLTARILLNICNGAIWGVLARKGLMVLTDFPGAYLGGVVWANFAACFIMGIAVTSENAWMRLLDDTRADVMFSSKGTVPFYVGITTGFCGTCLSFSSFILEAFNKAANTLPQHEDYPNSAYGIMEALSVILTHVGLSTAGFHAGKHLTGTLDRFSIPRHFYPKLEYGSTLVGVAAYIVVIVLIPIKKSGLWRSWTFLCLLAPWGAMLRYILLKKLNAMVKNFPMGTFTANMLGCLLLAVFTLISRGKRYSYSLVPIVTNVVGCHVIVGLDDGFCGALTTVSTFVVELFGLELLKDYRYGLVLVGAGFSLMVLILGSYNWTVGLTNSVCT